MNFKTDQILACMFFVFSLNDENTIPIANFKPVGIFPESAFFPYPINEKTVFYFGPAVRNL
jgi:hypothetical protein